MSKAGTSKPIAEDNKTPIAKAVKAATAVKTVLAQQADSATPVKPQAKQVIKQAAKPAPEAETASPSEKTRESAKKAAKAPAENKEKPKKPKLVRDSFTMPEAEYAVLTDTKKACLKDGIEVKKSELLRVGVALLQKLDTAGIKEVLAGLPALKAGRPKKGK